MEFIDLSRYIEVKKPIIPPFSKLKKMKHLLLTQHLKIVDEPENIEYAKSLAKKGITIASIKRQHHLSKYSDRKTFPRRICFEMTSRCNFRCRMCPQRNLKRPRMDMDKDLYCKVIDEIDTYGIEEILIYHLGESLLHPDFEQIINHISTKKNLGIIWMSTNGEFFTEEMIKIILNSNVDYINFSANAVTKKTYSKIVGKEEVFDTVQNNLNKLYELKSSPLSKPFIHCQMIEQEFTKNEVDAFIKKHYKQASIVSINMLEYVNLPNNKFGLSQRERKPLSSCTRVSRNDCFIMSDGHVTLCDAAYNHELDLGNINDHTLYDIWNGPERKRILKLNKDGRMNEIDFCKSCTDYDI